MNKRRQKEQRQQLAGNLRGLKEQVLTSAREMRYADVLNDLADFVGAGGRDGEAFAAGAWAYYHLDDFERAGKWVTTTLDADPGNVSVRLLLAHLCLREDRLGDALAVLSMVIEGHPRDLTQEQREEIEDMLAYYAKHESTLLQEKYPACWQFMQGGEPEAAPPPIGAGHLATWEEEAEVVPQGSRVPAPSAPAQKEAILAQRVSLRAKIRLLNSFAGAAFYDGREADAEELLEAALEIDPQNAQTIRNCAVLASARGDKAKALAFAGQMEEADFLLLSLLRGQD